MCGWHVRLMHCLLRLKRSWDFFLVILRSLFWFFESQVFCFFASLHRYMCLFRLVGGLGTLGSIWLLGKLEGGENGKILDFGTKPSCVIRQSWGGWGEQGGRGGGNGFRIMGCAMLRILIFWFGFLGFPSSQMKG